MRRRRDGLGHREVARSCHVESPVRARVLASAQELSKEYSFKQPDARAKEATLALCADVDVSTSTYGAQTTLLWNALRAEASKLDLLFVAGDVSYAGRNKNFVIKQTGDSKEKDWDTFFSDGPSRPPPCHVLAAVAQASDSIEYSRRCTVQPFGTARV